MHNSFFFTEKPINDIMKNPSEDEQLQIMGKGGIILTRTEKENKKLWHAMAGEAYLRCEMNINDEELLREEIKKAILSKPMEHKFSCGYGNSHGLNRIGG